MQFCQICVSCATKQCCTILKVPAILYLVVANISFSWLYFKKKWSRIKKKIIGRKNKVFYEVSKCSLMRTYWWLRGTCLPDLIPWWWESRLLRNVVTSLPNYSVIYRKTVTTIRTVLWTLNLYRFSAYFSRKNELNECVNIGKHITVQHNKFYEYQIIIIITLLKVRFDGRYIYIYIHTHTHMPVLICHSTTGRIP